MEFTRLGFSVYSSEVDDRGIDMVVRKDEFTHYDIQVKSLRKGGYVFMEKTKFTLRANNLVAVVVFVERESPHMFLIPSLAWQEPDALLCGRDYPAPLKSKPEWGVNISRKNWSLLERFTFEKEAARL